VIEDERGIGIDTIADFASQGSAIDVAEGGRIELLRGVDIARNADSEAVDDEVVRAKGIEFDRFDDGLAIDRADDATSDGGIANGSRAEELRSVEQKCFRGRANDKLNSTLPPTVPSPMDASAGMSM
jgi:hypothetical protein